MADVDADVRRPSSEVLAVASLIKGRLGRRTSAPVRVAFVGVIEDDRPAGTVPPLAQLLRGGRGGEVRLKLELSFLWFAANPPHDLTYPARMWATLLGLEDPEGRGTRRVRQAVLALHKLGLITLDPRPGQPNRLVLLNEGRPGTAYELPGSAYNRARASGQEWRHRYVQLPDTLWINGWLATLSGAAVAMLLVLYVELGRRDPDTTDLWFSPSQALKLYGLSEDTRSKGLRELRAAGLITARKRSASRDVLDFRRLRNTYRINTAQLDKEAAVSTRPNPEPPMRASQAAFEAFFDPLGTAG